MRIKSDRSENINSLRERSLQRVSLLKKIEVIGFDDQGNRYDGEIHSGQFRERQLPPLEFEYTQFDPEKESSKLYWCRPSAAFRREFRHGAG